MTYHLIHTIITGNNKRYEMFGDYSLSQQRVTKVIEYTLSEDSWLITNINFDISEFVNAGSDPLNTIFKGSRQKTNDLHEIISYIKSIQ